jgi:hypothetical protein
MQGPPASPAVDLASGRRPSPSDPPAGPDAGQAPDRGEQESPHREHGRVPNAWHQPSERPSDERADPDQSTRRHAHSCRRSAPSTVVQPVCSTRGESRSRFSGPTPERSSHPGSPISVITEEFSARVDPGLSALWTRVGGRAKLQARTPRRARGQAKNPRRLP